MIEGLFQTFQRFSRSKLRGFCQQRSVARAGQWSKVFEPSTCTADEKPAFSWTALCKYAHRWNKNSVSVSVSVILWPWSLKPYKSKRLLSDTQTPLRAMFFWQTTESGGKCLHTIWNTIVSRSRHTVTVSVSVNYAVRQNQIFQCQEPAR